MDLPSTATQLAVLVLVALPGVVYATVRNRARGLGASSISASSKIGEGLAAGVVFDLIYLVVFGKWLVRAFTPEHGVLPLTRAAAGLVLVLGVLVPAGFAWFAHRGSRWTRPSSGPVHWAIAKTAQPRSTARAWLIKNFGTIVPAFSRTPTAWDYVVPNRGERLVRIETASGKFVGGWFAENSFVSTYPEAHDIFVQKQWRITENGTFGGPVSGSSGFWYALQPGDIIDWIDPEEADRAPGSMEGTDGGT